MFTLFKTAISIFFAFASGVLIAEEALLIQNMPNTYSLPKKWRTTKDLIKGNTEVPCPNTDGLKEMNASASGQFSENSLQVMIKTLKAQGPVFIVDLREESHGFMNGNAVSWYAYRDWGNKGKNLKDINEAEKQLFKEALQEKNIIIYDVLSKTGFGNIGDRKPVYLALNRVSNEAEVVDSAGLFYVRIPVTDHVRPTTESVDQFIRLVRDLPENASVHFHCSAGVGRSTTFLTMYDAFRNAKNVSLDDIFNRQWLLGGLRFQTNAKPSSWKYATALERLDFVKAFYLYCRDNKDGYQELWSEYLQRTGTEMKTSS